MKRIGQFTTHKAINYGAVLQAYALKKVLANYDTVVETIDVLPNSSRYGRKIRYDFTSFKSLLYSMLLFIKFKYRIRHKRKVNSFDQFVNEEFVLIDMNSFKETINRYDYLVCGSDQIWNLNLLDEPYFFLDFGDIDFLGKRVAYAPSITEKMSMEKDNRLLNYMSNFESLSLREFSDVDKYSNLLGRKIYHVLDPVFLLRKDQWMVIAEKPENFEINDFILSYGLVSNNALANAIKVVKSALGIKHVDIQVRPFNKYKADVCLNDFNPRNFIWLFLNATFICTSSFHGTAFSVLFNKMFLSAPSSDRSSRIVSLLDSVGLSDRIINDNDSLKTKKLLKEINYNQVNISLNEQIKNSLNYLTGAFGF